jgi:hypothetical protein
VYRESIVSQLMDSAHCDNTPQFQGTTSTELPQIEIFLAKIVSLRYIAFVCFIRYVGVRTL